MDRYTPNGSIGALGSIEETFDGGSQLVCTRDKPEMTIVEDVQLCVRK
jgi:hypothetical protein